MKTRNNGIERRHYTVVGENINILKTTFDLNFYFYQPFKQHGYTKKWKQREAVNKKASF